MNSTITSSPEWMRGFICGLVCGEGNFTIAVVKNDACKLGYHIRAIFQIELHAHDEHVLKLVQGFFGCGNLFYPKPRTRVRVESPTVRYAVTAIPDNMRLAAFFRANPLIGVKQNAFEIWAVCLEIMQTGRHTSSDGFNEIVELRKNLNQIRRPSSYRTFEVLTTTAKATNAGRRMATWTLEEERIVQDYLDGQITLEQLHERIHRSPASIFTKITRLKQERTSQA